MVDQETKIKTNLLLFSCFRRKRVIHQYFYGAFLCVGVLVLVDCRLGRTPRINLKRFDRGEGQMGVYFIYCSNSNVCHVTPPVH